MTQMCELLESRLQEVLRLLQAGKCEEAEELVSLSSTLLTPPISAEHLDRLQILQKQCLEAARTLESTFLDQLRQSGMSRRANAAYRDAGNGAIL